MRKTKATEIPWEVHIYRRSGSFWPSEILHKLNHSYRVVVGKETPLTKEDAEKICRCVNNFDELLNCCKEFCRMGAAFPSQERIIERMKAAICKAEAL